MTFRGSIEELQNAVVVDREGDKVGKVGQVYLDNDTQQPSWVTVNTGLFGTSESFVPLAEASYTDGTVTVAHEKSFIKDAPNLEADGELARGKASCTATTEEVDVTLTEERPVVDKETVATENVRLGKRSVQDEETVQTDVSHEEVDVDGLQGDRRREDGRGR